MGTNSIIPDISSITPSTVLATNRPNSGSAIAREMNADNHLTNNTSVDRLESFKPNIRGSRKQPLIMRYPIDLGNERTEVPHVMQFKIYWRWENPEIGQNAPKLKAMNEDAERRLTAQAGAEDFVNKLLDDLESFDVNTKTAQLQSKSLGIEGLLRNPVQMNPSDPSGDAALGRNLTSKASREEGRREIERGIRSRQDRIQAIDEDILRSSQTGGWGSSEKEGWGATDITPAIGNNLDPNAPGNDVLAGRFNAILSGLPQDDSAAAALIGSAQAGLAALGLKQRDPQYDQMVSIYLPMCTRINNEDTFGYTDMDMKIPAAAMKVLGSLGSSENFSDFSSRFMDAAKQGAAGYITSALSNTAFAGVVPSLTGLVLNPRIEKMFQQKDLRQFTFSWDFYPRNEDEVRSVKDIIDTFRYHSHPSRTKSGDINNEQINQDPQIMLRVPAEFTVKFLSSQNNENGSGYVENEYIPKISRCVITSISVDYTPNGVFSTLKDNSPTAYTLSISVSEIAQLTREDVETGF